MWNLPCGTGFHPKSLLVVWTDACGLLRPCHLCLWPCPPMLTDSWTGVWSPQIPHYLNTIRNVSHTNLQSLAQSYQSLEGQIQAITLMTVNSDQGCDFHPKALLIQSLMAAGDGNQGNGSLVPFS